jgi:hypothetical protein
LAKEDKKQLMDSMKRDTNGAMYQLLLKYLELRIADLKDRLLTETDMDEVKRIQGRGLEIRDMLAGLTRRPVAIEFDGAYNQ